MSTAAINLITNIALYLIDCNNVQESRQGTPLLRVDQKLAAKNCVFMDSKTIN